MNKRTLDNEGVCIRCGAPDVHCFCSDVIVEPALCLAEVAQGICTRPLDHDGECE